MSMCPDCGRKDCCGADMADEIERLRELTANATCPCGHKGDTRESRSFCSVGHCYGCLSDQIWSQHDELIIAKREIERLKREIGEAYERAVHVCDALYTYKMTWSQAMRALKTEAPTNETGNARMGGE